MSTVQSVQRAFALLQQLASEDMGVTELADAADLPKSTVARLLKTLEYEGAVELVDDTGRYRIGPSITSLAGSMDRSPDLIARVRPHLVVLAQATGEDAGFSIPDGNLTHYVAQTESDNPVQVRDWTGERLPMHTVASGLATLAFSTPSAQDRYLERPIKSFTDTTMTDPDDLRRRFTKIVADGYVWCEAEYVDGLRAVAAPILGPTGEPIAAIHVHGPSYRFPPDDEWESVAAVVVEKAQLISDQVR